MNTLSVILISIVALEHLYFLVLEMFLWTTPKGVRAFGLKSKAFAEETKDLAANQGLYNGFLAAGVIFSIVKDIVSVTVFFLICVIIAALYGAYSTKQIRLLYIQGIPAIIALTVVLLNLA